MKSFMLEQFVEKWLLLQFGRLTSLFFFSSDSSRMRESRDERKARQLGIPFSLSDLIDSPMEEFNAMMSNTKLTDEQIALCRDIRRRGKNKVGLV